MTDMPTFILVHGFWGGAANWAKVITRLSALGHKGIKAVENPPTSLADDAERTRKMIAQVNGPILLAGHSYGGTVITEAGNQPNVAGLVYIAAFTPDAGESLLDVGNAAPTPPGVLNAAPDSDGFVWIDPARRHKPCWYQISSEDRMIHPDDQVRLSGRIGATTITLDADHASLASGPHEVPASIDQAACALAG
jgi:pimeloyl-ACP methyl ester carboxylesterase